MKCLQLNKYTNFEWPSIEKGTFAARKKKGLDFASFNAELLSCAIL